MAAPPKIRMFTYSYIAFYRPRKRLYFCLKYVPGPGVWEPFSLSMVAEGTHASLHKSTIHNIRTPLHLTIRTSPQTDRLRERFNLNATGLYLKIPLRDGTTITAAIVDRGMAMQGKYVVQEIAAMQGFPYEAARGCRNRLRLLHLHLLHLSFRQLSSLRFLGGSLGSLQKKHKSKAKRVLLH